MLQNRFAAFNFGNIDRGRFLELEESAECRLTFGLVVDKLAVNLELFVIAALHGLAESSQGLRSPKVLLPFLAEGILATRL